MAGAIVQSNSSQQTTTNPSLSFNSNLTVGNKILLWVAHKTQSNPAAPTKSGGTATLGTITLIDQGNSATGLAKGFSLYRADVTGSGSCTISFTTASNSECIIAEISGLASGAENISGHVLQSGTVATPSVSITTTIATAFIVGFVNINVNQLTIHASSSGNYTIDQNPQGTGGPCGADEYRNVSSTGTYAVDWNESLGNWIACAVAFSSVVTASLTAPANASLASIALTESAPASASLRSTNTRTVPANSALQATNTRTVPANVRLQATNTRTVAANVSLTATGLTRTAPESVALRATSTRTAPSFVYLSSQATKSVQTPANAALRATNTRSAPVSSSLQATNTSVTSAFVILPSLTRQVAAFARLRSTSSRFTSASVAFPFVALTVQDIVRIGTVGVGNVVISAQPDKNPALEVLGGYQYGIMAPWLSTTSDSNGNWAILLPWPSQTLIDSEWEIRLPGGVWHGVPPEGIIGPINVYALVSQYGWWGAPL